MNASLLNEQQLEAVEHLGTPLLVLAGAGSGKTRVIVEKIARLVRDRSYAADAIAAITFTNKAAREMQQRLGERLGADVSASLHLSTFHTLGLKLIRKDPTLIGYRPSFSIFDEHDSTAVVAELLPNHKRETLSSIRWQISSYKNRGLSPEDASGHAENELQQLAASVYPEYQRRLQAYNGMDFDDLLLLPLRLFSEHPTELEYWRGRLRYFLVDEYQDTNQPQYLLLKALAGASGNFTAVGDDDQSIYAWRGARPENLELLQSDYPNLRIVKLEQNYRSSQRILSSANTLIRHNPHSVEKQLWSQLGEGERIRVMVADTPEHEAERIVHSIVTERMHSGIAYDNFAILYRGNHQSRVFEKLLRENAMPYKVSGGQSFFERAEIRDVMAYLRLLNNPEDDTAFLRIINTPRRQIGPATLEKLALWARERKLPLLLSASELGLAQQLDRPARLRLGRLTDWMAQMQNTVRSESPVRVLDKLLRDIDYADWIRNQARSPDVAQRKLDNVEDFRQWVGRLSKRHDNLNDLVQFLGVLQMIDDQDGEAKPSIQLSTVHAAKGLEFRHVFLCGMEEGLLPHSNSLDTGMLEEERRLAYVGITRAREKLVLSFARQRSRAGKLYTTEPSRFLGELPAEHLDDERQPAAEDSLENARAFLQAMKQEIS